MNWDILFSIVITLLAWFIGHSTGKMTVELKGIRSLSHARRVHLRDLGNLAIMAYTNGARAVGDRARGRMKAIEMSLDVEQPMPEDEQW